MWSEGAEASVKGMLMDSFEQIPPLEGTPTPPPEQPQQGFMPEPEPGNAKKVVLLLVAAGLIVAAGVLVVANMMKGKTQPLAPSAVEIGDPRDKVIRILGKPQGVTVKDKTEILLYAGGHVEIEDGKVTYVSVGKDAQRGAIMHEGRSIILLNGGRIQTQSKEKEKEK